MNEETKKDRDARRDLMRRNDADSHRERFRLRGCAAKDEMLSRFVGSETKTPRIVRWLERMLGRRS